MAKKKETVKTEVTINAKPSLNKGVIFEFGEIKVPLLSIESRELFDKLYLGKLRRTDINKAWEASQKQRSKYA